MFLVIFAQTVSPKDTRKTFKLTRGMNKVHCVWLKGALNVSSI